MRLGQRLGRLLVGILLIGSAEACGGRPDATAIAGSWQWFTGYRVEIDTNGDVRVGPVVGDWASEDTAGRRYRIDWYNGYVDQLTLSGDDNTLDGFNQYDAQVTAWRAH
jgi:hypothetical protein